jgi:hypothetical protein
VSLSGWIVMVLVLGGVWGGFVYLLIHTARADAPSAPSGTDRRDGA